MLIDNEIQELEAGWNGYRTAWKGYYSQQNSDLSLNIINSNQVNMDIRMHALENVVEKLVSIVTKSKDIEKNVIDRIVNGLKD